MNQNNLPATRAIAAPTPQLAQSLSQDRLDEHRAKIAFEVEVIMDGYWDKHPPAHVKAGIMADWADSLEDWTQEQILYALRKWRDQFPSKKPNPGHIKGMLKETRGRAEARRNPAPKPAEPANNRVTADATQAIMDEIGWRPKTFGGKA